MALIQTRFLALLGLAVIFAGMVFNFVMPGIRYYAWVILALGTALVSVAFVFDFRRVRQSITSHQGKFGVGTTVGVSLFFAIIFFINAISIGYYHRFDFTGLAQFTLTSQTKMVLMELDEPVEIITFFSPNIPPQVRLYGLFLLDEYKLYSKKLSIRNLDPELNPDQVRQYGINRLGAIYGSVVFKGEEGQTQVYGPQITAEAEYAFTSAILQVTGSVQKKVYFTKGHGESSIEGDYSKARSGLKENLFEVGEIDLLHSGIPEETAVLVIPGPSKELDNKELNILNNYLQNKGKLLLLLNPNPGESWKKLLASWWIDILDGTLLDPSSHVTPNIDHPLVPRNHNTFGYTKLYFPGSAGLVPKKDSPEKFEILPVAWSSKKSWMRKDYTSGSETEFDEKKDKKGPFVLGAIINFSGTSIVIFADSDFASNTHFYNGNNSDLFLNIINRLAADKELISVNRKVLSQRRLILSPEQVRFFHLSSIGLFPLLLLAIGGYIRWRRR